VPICVDRELREREERTENYEQKRKEREGGGGKEKNAIKINRYLCNSVCTLPLDVIPFEIEVCDGSVRL
jgi:hypothetical protein